MGFDSSRADVKTHKALLLARVTEHYRKIYTVKIGEENMGSISMPQGRGNIAHNTRCYEEGKMPSNIDVSRNAENVIIHHETVHAAYRRIFDEALDMYNSKQNRADRKIKDYYQHIKNSKNGEKLFYEDVLQWGKKEDFQLHPELRELAKQCLLEFMEGSKEKGILSFEERNPGLEIIGAYIHMDEASPHMHFDYIPVATGYKTGLQKRNSLDRTMKALIKARTGHDYTPRAGEVNAKGKCIDNATKQWKEMERAVFRSICISRGLLVDEEIKTPERDSLSVLDYKREMREKEVKALESQAETLKGEILTTEQIYDIDIHKPLLGQKIKISYLEYMSLKKTAEHIDEVEADAKSVVEQACKQVDLANARADEGIKAANDRADEGIAEAERKANEMVARERKKAKKQMDEAKAMKSEADAIISSRDSIIKDAMETAKAIIQEAIEKVPEKTKEAFNNLKKKIRELTKTQKELEADIEEKTGLGDRILKEKQLEAAAITISAKEERRVILEVANSEADDIRGEAKSEADKIMEEAIKNSGAEGVVAEISRRLEIVSLKELANAKKKVMNAYAEYKKYDHDGSIARAIEEENMKPLDECFCKSFVRGSNDVIEKEYPWHDAIFEVYRYMGEYLKLKEHPHSIDDVMEDIQKTLTPSRRERKR